MANCETSMRNIRVQLTYRETGQMYHWTIRRVQGACNVGLPDGKSRVFSGWEFESHDGCIRMVEGTWRDLVPYFHAVADNYGMTCTLS